MPSYQEIPSDDLAVLATVIAIWFSKVLTLEELNFLGNFVVATGGIMLSIAAQEETLKTKNVSSKEPTMQDLQGQIDKLNKEVASLKEKLNQKD